MKLSLEKVLEPTVAGAVGVIDIVTRQNTVSLGAFPFGNTVDMSRLGINLGSLIGNIFFKSKTLERVTRAGFVSSLPLLELSIYNYAKTTYFKGTPLALQRPVPPQPMPSQSQVTFEAGTGGVPVVNNGAISGGASDGHYF